MENGRGHCKGCPWINKDSHSLKWPSYVEKMNTSGLIKNGHHRCHMIDSKIWDEPTQNNVCIGSLKN